MHELQIQLERERKMKNLIRMVCLGVLFTTAAGQVQAGFVFSNLSYTANSVTFTINGDMTGYTPPSGDGNLIQFSLRYGAGDIWAGVGGFTQNTWSTSVFDNSILSLAGNTGTFPFFTPMYSWSWYTNSLSGAQATNRTVTLTLGDNYLNTSATNPIVEFYWGNGADSQNPTLIGTLSTVPEPASMVIWGIGAISMGLVARRRAKKVAAV